MKNTINTSETDQLRVSRRFNRVGIITIVAVYLVVLAGGIVRSTGSGMGCPDWPKCFGSWVPPTEASQLPPFYKVDYANKRQVKNEKLACYLDRLGFSELANQIRVDSGSQEAPFNPVKTWIEYVNRLLGVLVGVLIFLTLICAIPFIKTDGTVFYLSLLAFVLVGFQGWLGSVVVSTNLLPGTVTVHMLLAIAIIFLLIYTVNRSDHRRKQAGSKVTNKRFIKRLVLLAMIVSLCQVLLGTQVREAIDQAIRLLGYAGRANWIGSLGMEFYIHRSFSWFIMAIHGYLIYQLLKNAEQDGVVFKRAVLLSGLVGLEILIGITMAYWAVPAFLQPIHLTLAFIILGIQFVIILLLNKEAIFAKNATESVPAVSSNALS
jgi:heme a synthase